jgi:hypothetical protein
MYRRIGSAALLLLLLALTSAPAHAAPRTLTGLAEIDAPDCAEGAYKFPIESTTDGGPVWIAVRPIAAGVFCPEIYYSGLNVFAGSWNPDKGGCIPSITHENKALCLGAVPQTLTKTTTSVSLCVSVSQRDCWLGTATVIRT